MLLNDLKLLFILMLFSSSKLLGQSNQKSINTFNTKLEKLNKTIHSIEKYLLKGKMIPQEIYTNTDFNPLFNNPKARIKIRNLLRKYPGNGKLCIIDSLDGGDLLEVKGLIIDNKNIPISGALVYFFSVDSNGQYAPEYIKPGHGSNNPKLFGYLKTTEQGEFTFITTNPPSYIGLNNIRHIHYNISLPNGTQQGGEFIFDKNPSPTRRQYEWAKRLGFQIINQQKKDNIYYCNISIQVHSK